MYCDFHFLLSPVGPVFIHVISQLRLYFSFQLEPPPDRLPPSSTSLLSFHFFLLYLKHLAFVPVVIFSVVFPSGGAPLPGIADARKGIPYPLVVEVSSSSLQPDTSWFSFGSTSL